MMQMEIEIINEIDKLDKIVLQECDFIGKGSYA